MSHTIDYSMYKNIDEKEDKAMEDIKFWLGDSYDRITDILKESKTKEGFLLGCSFAGIKGYPAEVLYKRLKM